MKRVKRRFLCIVILGILASACEIPNYKGTVDLDFNSTSDFGQLQDMSRYVYQLRVRTLSATGATRLVGFRVTEAGTYRLQHQSLPRFGTISLYSFEDAARSGGGVFVNPVRTEYSGGGQFSSEPISVYELDVERFYAFEAEQGSARPLVGFFDYEFWRDDRWW